MPEDVVKLQNPDGGFPSMDQKGNPSSLNSTSAVIGGLVGRSDVEGRDSLRRACEWIFSTQSEEGAFIEPEELASVPRLPPWIQPGKPTPNMPQIVAYLLQAGYHDRRETKRAISHLMRYWQSPDGSFKRKYMVWCMIEVLRRLGLPENSKRVQEAIRATRRYFLGAGRNDPPALLWCLNSLRLAGFGKDHVLVEEVHEQLMALRNDDGGWSTEDLEGRIQTQSDLLFTRNVLATLQAFGSKDF